MATPASMIPPEQSAPLVGGVLRQTRHRLARVSLLTAACGLLAGTALFVLGFVVADHYIDGGVPATARFAMLAVYALAAAIGTAVLIVLPAVRRISNLYAARLLERANPTFQNSLINAIQLETHEELPGSVRSALLARAAVDASRADVGRAVAVDRLRQAGIALGVVMLIFAVYAIIAPKPVLPSVFRAFGSSLPAPTRTTIVDVEPVHDASVIIGRPVTFTARLAGRIPEEASIHFSFDAGTTILNGQHLSLLPAGPADASGRAQIWQGTKAGQDVQQTMYWRLTAGDASSTWRRLAVRSLPDVTDLRVSCVYPSYTALAPTSFSAGQSADVDAIIGTQVTVEAATNVPVRDPVVVVTADPGQGDETRLPMQHVDLDATRISGQFTVLGDGQYYLRFFDRDGEPNQDPIRHTIRARPDRPPRVILMSPAGLLELQAAETLHLRGLVEDDFGISRLAVEYKRGDQAGSISVTMPADQPGTQPTTRPAGRRMSVQAAAPLAQFGAVPGDVIEWRLAAWDNHVDLKGRLAPQKGLGPMRRIIVRAPEAIARAEPPPPDGSQAATRPADTGNAQSPTSMPSPQEGQNLDNQAIAQAKQSETQAVEQFIREHQQELARLREHLAKPDEPPPEDKPNPSEPAPPPNEPQDKVSPDEKTAAKADGAQPPQTSQPSPPQEAQAAQPADQPKPGSDTAQAEAAPNTDAKPGQPSSTQEQAASKPEQGDSKPEQGDSKPEQAAAKTGSESSSADPTQGQTGAKAEQGKSQTGESQGQASAGGQDKAGQTQAGVDAQNAGENGQREGQGTGVKAPGTAAQGQQAGQDAQTPQPAPTPGGQGPGAPGQEKTQGQGPGKDGQAPQPAPVPGAKAPGAAGQDKAQGQGQEKGEQTPSPNHQASGQSPSQAAQTKQDTSKPEPKGQTEGNAGQAASPRDAGSEPKGAQAPEKGQAQTDAKSDGVSQVSGQPNAVEQGQGEGREPASQDDGVKTGNLKSDTADSTSGTKQPRPDGEKEQARASGTGKGQGESQQHGPGQTPGEDQPTDETASQSSPQQGDEAAGSKQSPDRSPEKPQAEGQGQGEGQQPGQGEQPGEDSTAKQAQGMDQAQAESQGEAKDATAAQQGQTPPGPGQEQTQGQGIAGQAKQPGEPQESQEAGPGQAQAKGQGKGEASAQGEGADASQGQGPGPDPTSTQTNGPGSSQGQNQDGGQNAGAGEQKPGTAAPASGVGAGSGNLSGVNPRGGPAPNAPDDSAPIPNPQPSAPPADHERLETIGDVLPVIDALEQRLRNKEVDPKLLDDLGWDEGRANEFVREFRRAEGQSKEQFDVAAPGEQFETTTRPSVTVERSNGASPDAVPLSATNVREPDKTNQLFEVGRQKISDEYRDYLKAYYESIARDRTPASQPAK